MHKRAYILALTVALFSLTVLPTAAAALPAEVSEYMARLAAGKLYVPYYLVTVDESNCVSTEEQSSPPGYSVPLISEENVDETNDEMIAVQAMNLSRYEIGDQPELMLMNETSYTVFPAAAADTVLHIEKGAVLIMHTHGTEAYLPDGATSYSKSEDFRSTNAAETVVAVGEVFASALRQAGIEVYHDTTMYDKDNFQNAYTSARSAAKQWLLQKPQIRYIIDLHRDAVSDADGKYCKTLCSAGGYDSAQLMLVVGTNEAGASHSDWRDNMCVAAKYQRFLNKYPTLARPIYLRKASFNQQLCKGSMLLEVGSAANTLSEAKRAAMLAAECFISLYDSVG